MINLKPKVSIYLLGVCIYLISFNNAVAQGFSSEMESLFSAKEKRDHITYMPESANEELNTFWIDADTLYSCVSWEGVKIALSDINFDKKMITKGKMLVKNTQDNVYYLSLETIDKRPAFSFECFGLEVDGSGEADPDLLLRLDMENAVQAEEAFAYLVQLSKQNITAIPEDPLPSDQNSGGNKSGDFDSQLSSLIYGIKDDFESLRGGKVNEKQFMSKVQLDGAISTNIYIGMLFNTYLIADFGKFKTREEAEAVYEKMAARISKSKMPVTMIKLEEIVSPSSKTHGWVPFGVDDPDMKKFSIVLDVIKTITFDDKYNMLDVYAVSLRIKK